eukprot:2743305-Pleurochrysis_carterae.AAC.1
MQGPSCARTMYQCASYASANAAVLKAKRGPTGETFRSAQSSPDRCAHTLISDPATRWAPTAQGSSSSTNSPGARRQRPLRDSSNDDSVACLISLMSIQANSIRCPERRLGERLPQNQTPSPEPKR